MSSAQTSILCVRSAKPQRRITYSRSVWIHENNSCASYKLISRSKDIVLGLGVGTYWPTFTLWLWSTKCGVSLLFCFFCSDIFKQIPLIESGDLPPYKETRIPAMTREPFGRLFSSSFKRSPPVMQERVTHSCRRCRGSKEGEQRAVPGPPATIKFIHVERVLTDRLMRGLRRSAN
jgi:hypothetical protein